MRSVGSSVLLFYLCLILCLKNSLAQSTPPPRSAPSTLTAPETSSIVGTILDPSGAVIAGADIALEPVSGTGAPGQTARSSSEGRYTMRGIEPGTYMLRVVAKGFAVFESKPLAIEPTRPLSINIRLGLETAKVQVDVSGESAVDTDPSRNADAVVLRGSAIDRLPTDPAVLADEIRALSNGDAPAIYVDSFSGGVIPPKDTIREIRINQNSYSARNDTDPVSGLVEIFTKPGAENLHATFFQVGSDSSFDSRNPFITSQPPYYFTQSQGDIGGSLDQRSSYFFNYLRRVDAGNAIIHAETLDSSLHPVEVTQALPSPATQTTISPRLDFQRGEKSTIGLRYTWVAHRQTNDGIGQLSLPDQSFQNDQVTQTFQASDSQILSEKVVDDIRLQYVRGRTRQTPTSTAPTINVQGAFIDGGNSAGAFHNNEDRFEFQNYLAIQAGRHYLSPGVRVRVDRDANVSRANYNGQFVFPSLAAYQAAQAALAQCRHAFAAAGPCTATGASQFSITTGTPATTVATADLALFFQDDWKLSPKFTLSYGLRYEVQNHMADLGDLGPRVAVSRGLGGTDKKAPRLLLRVASGVFYTRLPTPTILQARRQNGAVQANYIVADPTFYPLIPAVTTFGPQSLPTIFQIQPSFHSPYTWNSTVSLEHPLGSRGTLTFNYVYSRGIHLGLTRNINSPVPGTYTPGNPSSGIYPLRTLQNVEQYESTGISRGHRLFGSINLRGKGDAFFYSSYTLRLRNTDVTPGLPSNGYNLEADYGRAAIPAQSFVLDGDFPLPRIRIGVSGSLYVTSGTPFNITVGQDLNGDSQFNDRPAFATDLSRPSVIQTAYGAFDTAPIAGQTVIPINYATGPAQISTNLQIYRSFTFGPPMPSSPTATARRQHLNRKYNLLFGVEAQNPLNHVNLDTPVSVLGSPLFGKSTALAGGATSNANRVINLLLEVRF